MAYRRKESTRGELKRQLKRLDMFGPHVNILVDGDDKKETLLGSCFTVLIVVLTVTFAVIKYEVMTHHKDTVINTKEFENYYLGN